MKSLIVPKALAHKSIENLEKARWEPPDPNASEVALRCHELRRKAIEELDVSDIRLLIGQDIGLQFLIPIALKLLETDPLVECEHYKGDLLAVVLRANPNYFADNAGERSSLIEVIDFAKSKINLLDHIDFDITNEALEEALQVFELGQKAYGRRGVGAAIPDICNPLWA